MSTGRRLVLLARALFFCALLAPAARAHELRPAYLELRQTSTDTWDVLWKVPALPDGRRLGLYVHLPDDVERVREPVATFSDSASVERWSVRRPGGLDGATVRIDGLSATRTDVLVRVERAGGATQTARILPDAPSFTIVASPSAWDVSATYLHLGVEHILFGIDHLLFVLALVLLVKGRKRLVGTITAFTVAHSITLAAAALGFVHVPGPPVEVCIALSIVFVAAEIVHGRLGRAGLTERAPWTVAFIFGLLHGLGFAGALSDVGLPSQAIPWALAFFNVGVELGQLAFVAAVLVAAVVLRRLPLRAPSWGWRVAPYAIGSLAAFWVLQRSSAFLT